MLPHYMQNLKLKQFSMFQTATGKLVNSWQQQEFSGGAGSQDGAQLFLILVSPAQEGNISLALISVQVNGVQEQPQPKSCFQINEICIFHIFSWEVEGYLRSDGRCC